MNICVIGSGYVGLVTGACLADFGLNVTCVDNDKNKIDKLNKLEIPIFEPGLKELIEKNSNEGRLKFTIGLADSVVKSQVIFIAVGTPSNEDGSADLDNVKSVAGLIAEAIKGSSKDDYKVIVTKSTVPVGTGDELYKIIKGIVGDTLFDVVSNPEFLKEGTAIEDFMGPDRVVIGSSNEKSFSVMKEVYAPLLSEDVPFVFTDLRSSELIKYASNAFLATKVTFINEMANICEKLGADISVVSKGMGLDRRIGSKFLHPGPGFGGSCFPKDTRAVSRFASEVGVEAEIVDAVIDVNNKRIGLMVDRIKSALGGTVDGRIIGVLGLTFKPNTDDVRESPAVSVVNKLLESGAKIRAFDPEGMELAKGEISGDISYLENAYSAAEGSDCLVVLTEWNQFKVIDLEKVKELLKTPLIVDLRNVYRVEDMVRLGITYHSIGRQ